MQSFGDYVSGIRERPHGHIGGLGLHEQCYKTGEREQTYKTGKDGNCDCKMLKKELVGKEELEKACVGSLKQKQKQ